MYWHGMLRSALTHHTAPDWLMSLSHSPWQVGAMVVYILDALQYREAALLAVWLVLGLMNMCFGLTAVFFSDSNGIFIPVMTAIVNGITMFLVGTIMYCKP